MASPSPVHLAVDLGASSGRVIAGSLQGSRLELDVIHRFPNAAVRVQNSLQWDVLALWQHILDGLREARAQCDSIASVGVDTWGVDYVLVDSQDLVTGPVRSYRDSRTTGMFSEAFQLVPRREIFEATGLQFMEINTLYQLFSAVRAGESSLRAADGFLMMGDFFHWLLTGRRSIEVTNASTTQMLDPRTKDWSRAMLDRLGIPTRLLTELVEPGTNLGPIQASVASVTGLEGVPVIIPATHDTASAVLAVPAEGFAPAKTTWCYISSGTWSLMGCELARPLINDRCAEFNFTNEGGVRGSTRLLKNIGGLWIFQQIRTALKRRGAVVSWEAMVGEAKESKPFSLLLNPDEPSLTAPDDMIDAICAYAGRTGQDVPIDNGVLYRSALEGLALRYRSCLAMLEQLVGNRIDVIHIVGGGVQNQLLCQMTADACDRVVIAGPVEATAMGNVLMQMLGTGRLHSIDEARQLVRNSCDAVRYEPQQPEHWHEPARKFEALS